MATFFATCPCGSGATVTLKGYSALVTANSLADTSKKPS